MADGSDEARLKAALVAWRRGEIAHDEIAGRIGRPIDPAEISRRMEEFGLLTAPVFHALPEDHPLIVNAKKAIAGAKAGRGGEPDG